VRVCALIVLCLFPRAARRSPRPSTSSHRFRTRGSAPKLTQRANNNQNYDINENKHGRCTYPAPFKAANRVSAPYPRLVSISHLIAYPFLLNSLISRPRLAGLVSPRHIPFCATFISTSFCFFPRILAMRTHLQM